jgi:hypothetical protein
MRRDRMTVVGRAAEVEVSNSIFRSSRSRISKTGLGIPGGADKLHGGSARFLRPTGRVGDGE